MDPTTLIRLSECIILVSRVIRLTLANRLGWAVQGLGTVRLKQGRLDESFDAYQRALANYKATTGPRYFRTVQVHMRLGEHYALRRKFIDAE